MRNFITIGGAFALAGVASAAFHLQITEVYEGAPGEDATADWIEITNFGDVSYDFGVDGDLFFDDGSADPTVDARLTGVSSIGVGESVVIVLSTDTVDVDEFIAAWGASNLVGVQIGSLLNDAPGLGQGGEDVYLFDGNTAGASVIDSTSYLGSDNGGIAGSTWTWSGDADSLDTVSVLGVNGAFQGVAFAGDSGEFALIGSPGAIPAPGSAALLGLGGLVAVRRRR